jgi:hypothetical protein
MRIVLILTFPWFPMLKKYIDSTGKRTSDITKLSIFAFVNLTKNDPGGYDEHKHNK